MDIDIPLTAEDRKRLTQALGPSWNADDVAILLARAGASEILALATGRTVPATLADARAFRIFNLLQQGMSLSDAETLVAAIFKVPSATAKRLVNSAVARYAIELQQGLSGTIGEVLEATTWDQERERWDVGMPTTFIRERILEAAGRLPVPDPSWAAGSLWRFPDETYQAVRKESGSRRDDRNDDTRRRDLDSLRSTRLVARLRHRLLRGALPTGAASPRAPGARGLSRPPSADLSETRSVSSLRVGADRT